LTIAALLAFLGWVAWAMPVEDMAGAPAVDADAFWAAVGFGLLASCGLRAARFIARKAKGRSHGHF
jgi:predicted tellurium resistance membrane protein TerC